ncbi:MAG: hypothetical protein ABI134_00615 [Byssovorax sp.]
MTSASTQTGAMPPRVLIVHSALDGSNATRLADAFVALGINATPFARILATNKTFRTTLTALMLRADATVLLLSRASNDDSTFERAMAIIADLSSVVGASHPIVAVRAGEIDIPGPVNRGYVTVTLDHFRTDDGINAIAASVRTLLAAQQSGRIAAPVLDRDGASYPSAVPGPEGLGIDREQAPSKLKPSWQTSALSAVTSMGVLFAACGAMFAYYMSLIPGGRSDLWKRGCQISLIFGTFMALRAFANAHQAQSRTRLPASESIADWGPKVAGVIGASAAVITAVVQGGNATLQYVLAAQKDGDQHAFEIAQASQKHEQVLDARAHSYLELTLANESYNRRLTLLGFLAAIPSGVHAGEGSANEVFDPWLSRSACCAPHRQTWSSCPDYQAN